MCSEDETYRTTFLIEHGTEVALLALIPTLTNFIWCMDEHLGAVEAPFTLLRKGFCHYGWHALRHIDDLHEISGKIRTRV